MNRVVRSTSVPIAELPSPRIRSPSQSPGTALSPISDGRSLIINASVRKDLPRLRALEFTSPVQTGAVFTLMPLISAGFALLFIGQLTGPDVLVALGTAGLGTIWVIFAPTFRHCFRSTSGVAN